MPGSSSEEPPAKRIRAQISMTPGLIPRMLYKKTMAFPGLMLSMAIDMLITLMMKLQVMVSASQTRTILILR